MSDEVVSDATDAKSQATDDAMSEEVASPQSIVTEIAPSAEPAIESPPPAAQPLRESDAEPRARLHRLAADLVRNRNRRMLVEFLQLRRALR